MRIYIEPHVSSGSACEGVLPSVPSAWVEVPLEVRIAVWGRRERGVKRVRVRVPALMKEIAEGGHQGLTWIPGIAAPYRVEEVHLRTWKGLFLEEGGLRGSGVTPITEEGFSGRLVPAERSGKERVWTEQFRFPWTPASGGHVAVEDWVLG